MIEKDIGIMYDMNILLNANKLLIFYFSALRRRFGIGQEAR